jgi:hypothetical protein
VAQQSQDMADAYGSDEMCSSCAAILQAGESTYLWGDTIVCATCYQQLSAPPIPPPMPMPGLHSCANCRRQIGALEQAYQWGQYVVCPQCLATLQQGTAATHAPQYQPDPRPMCPGCGSRERPVRKAKGSLFALIVLLMIMVLPGLIYMVIYSGYAYYCPRCGLKRGDAN